MGNNQSASGTKEQKRLTKQRTTDDNNPSAAQLSISTAFTASNTSRSLFSSSRVFDADASPATQQHLVEYPTSTSSSMSKLPLVARRFSKVDGALHEGLRNIAEFDDDAAASGIHNMAKYTSRTGSINSQQITDRSSTICFNNSRLSLSTSLSFAPTDEQIRPSENVQIPVPDGNASSFQRTFSPTSEEEIEDSVRPLPSRYGSTMIRRRSLAVTPGIATRYTISCVEDAIRPQQDKTQLATPESPLWMQEGNLPSPSLCPALLAPPNFRSGSPAQRAETPADLNYTHLGALKLGSLVVTNGGTSPDPAMNADLDDYSESKFVLDGENSEIATSKLPQRKNHRYTWSPNALRFPFEENEQKQIAGDTLGNCSSMNNGTCFRAENTGSDEARLRLGCGTVFEAIRDPRKARSESIVSPCTLTHPADAQIIYPESLGTTLRLVNQAPDEDCDSISEEASKSFREEALRMLEYSMTSQDQDKNNESSPSLSLSASTAQSSASLASTKKSTTPIQAKSDSGYCSEYSMGAFSRESSARSQDGDNDTSRKKGNKSAGCIVEGVEKKNSDREQTGDRSEITESLGRMARRKSSGFLRLSSKSWRQTTIAAQCPPDQGVNENVARSNALTSNIYAGPRKLQKKNPPTHQSFTIISNAKISPAAAASNSTDSDLCTSNVEERPQGTSAVTLTPSRHDRPVEKRGVHDAKKNKRKSFGPLRPLYQRSKSVPEAESDSSQEVNAGDGEKLACNLAESRHIHCRKSEDLQEQNKHRDLRLRNSLHGSGSGQLFSSESQRFISKFNTPTKASDLSLFQSSLPQSKSAIENDFTSSVAPSGLFYDKDKFECSSTDQSIKSEPIATDRTRDHRFDLDVPPVPSIPPLSIQTSPLMVDKVNDGIFTARLAQLATPTIVTSRITGSPKELRASKSNGHISDSAPISSPTAPSPTRKRFYKEIRERKNELGQGNRQPKGFADHRDLRGRKSYAGPDQRLAGTVNTPNLPLSIPV